MKIFVTILNNTYVMLLKINTNKVQRVAEIAITIVFTVIGSSCSTTMTLNQVKLKEGTKLINHYESTDTNKADYFVVCETKNETIAFVKLNENDISIIPNDQSDLIKLDTIYNNTNLNITTDSKFRLGNAQAYNTSLKKGKTNIETLDLSDDGISYLDNKTKGLNEAYFFTESLIYKNNKSIFQTLIIPFKFRTGVNGKPAIVNTSFNAGIAYGYQWKTIKVSPIYNRSENIMVGYDKKELSFSLAPFISLNSIELNRNNTSDSVLVEKNVLGMSFGGIGVVSLNKFNIGLALGLDYGLEDAKQWDYQGGLWLGLVLGIDIIK